MEKQENYNKEKFNQISIFLSKFIFRENFSSLKKSGYINAYISDPLGFELVPELKDKKLLFLLFKNSKLTTGDLVIITSSLAIDSIRVKFSYEIIFGYSMVVIEFPNEFKNDYNLIIEGKYSKLSQEFKNSFPIIKDVYNDKKEKIGKEYSIYYHIFNKTEWIKNFWMKKLNLIELNDNLELWEKPKNEDIIFDIKKLKQ